jgi:formate dehydrogenase beta subunit
MQVTTTSTETETITLTIDGVEVKTTEGKRILEAALDNGIYIPNLCALRDIKLPTGACRLCQVQIEGKRGTVTSCSEPAAEGMVIHSNTPEINKLRRQILEILLARHPSVCLTCHRRQRCQPGDICLRMVSVTEEQCILCPNNGRCELQRAVDFIGLEEQPFPYSSKGFPIEKDNPFIVRNNNLCILCGRCVRACGELLGIEAIAFNLRGRETYIGGAFGKPLSDSGCTFCGTCVEVCPTGALKDAGDEWNRWPDREAAAIRCKYNCPAAVDVPRFIRFIREGKYAEAKSVIEEKVPFAEVCSLICSHPCETACRRGDLDQPLAIRALERFAVERAGGADAAAGQAAPSTGKKVAIVGSGPAGLTAAYYLAKKGGHAVTVFEAESQAGGMLREMVPEFKLPRRVLDNEIERLKKLNVEIRTGTKVESLDKLLSDGYDAVFVGVGAHRVAKLGIEGESDSSVIDGLSFLRQVNAGQKVEVGANVAVIGSGYGAATAARVALRLGAKSATIISADSRMAIPGDELAETLAEGVEIKSSTSCVKIAAMGSKLRLECGPAGVQKARINGSGFAIDVDTLIAAAGGIADLPDQFGLGLGDRDGIQVDPEDLSTGRKGVFAGGDAVIHASFIEAVAAGRKAAISIDRYLGGSGDIEETLAPVTEGIPKIGRISNFAKRARGEMPCASPAERKTSFAQVEQGFSDDAGQQESLRCMGCDLRFIVGRMVAQP